MEEWRDSVDKECPEHAGRRMIVDKFRDGKPRHAHHGSVRVKCPVLGCDETSTVSELDARADLD